MFFLRSFSTQNNSLSELAKNTKTIIDFIRKYNIEYPGVWITPKTHPFFEVGVGRYGQKQALATSRFHLEIFEENKLLCFNKAKIPNDYHGYYQRIIHPETEREIIALLAEGIKDPNKYYGGDLKDLSEKDRNDQIKKNESFKTKPY